VYFWIFEAYNNGQTPGKKIFKLRTVDAQSKKAITPTQAFLHVLGKEIFLLLDLIIALFINKVTPEEQNTIRITQKLAGTVVIKLN
jgi:uncharacterized RDD family membrane protein YckC